MVLIKGLIMQDYKHLKLNEPRPANKLMYWPPIVVIFIMTIDSISF